MNIFGVALSTADLWLLALIIPCLGWLIPHRLTLWRERRVLLRDRVLEFEAAFAPEVAVLHDGITAINSLSSALEKHRAAIVKILPYLNRCDRARLQRAWDEYSGKNDGFHESEAEVVILGYNHPDLFKKGVKRFHALHSCLRNLTT